MTFEPLLTLPIWDALASAVSTSVCGTVGSAQRVCWHGNALSALLSLHEYDQTHGEPTRPPNRGYRGAFVNSFRAKICFEGESPPINRIWIAPALLMWSYISQRICGLFYKERALKWFYFLCRNTWLQLRWEKAKILINTHRQLSFSLEDELHPTMCFRSKTYYSHISLVCGFHFGIPSE